MAQDRAPMCLLITVVLFAIGAASGQDCNWRAVEMEECIMSGNLEFGRLVDPFYGTQLCSDLDPLVKCTKRNRQECPNITTFTGKSGRAIDDMFSTLEEICSGPVQEEKQVGQSGGRCPFHESQLPRRLNRCHDRFLTMNYSEDQMCRQLKKVVSCMNKLLRRCRHESWMEGLVAKQVELGARFMDVIRAVRYRCIN